MNNLAALQEALRKRALANAKAAEEQVMKAMDKPPATESTTRLADRHIISKHEVAKFPPALLNSIRKEVNQNPLPWKDQFPSKLSKLDALLKLRKPSAPALLPASESSPVDPNPGSSTNEELQESIETDLDTDPSPEPAHIILPPEDDDSPHRYEFLDIEPNSPALEKITDKYGNEIVYNEKQQSFIDTAGFKGESAVLIGAAGTGKTTCQKGVVNALISTGKAGILYPDGHKHLQADTPGIVVCAYTRRAVANIRKNVPKHMQNNCITIHKLLEYQPVYYKVTDPVTGDEKNKMVFEATRNAENPLPSSIKTLIFEEGSMLGTDLYKEVINACPHNPQLIFLGDIQQLPPVFGPAILGFKLLELSVVELTEVYRQALESPIISLAHRILSGNGIPDTEFPAWKREGQLTIRPWKKKISWEDALHTTIMMFIGAVKNGAQIPGLYQGGYYNPEEDIILIPFNKSFGTDELNKGIANFLAHDRKEFVYEIIAGFQKLYLSPNDKVLYDKEDATVLKIETNPAYSGAPFSVHSTTMDYWGHDPVVHGGDKIDDVDFLLAQVSQSSGEDRVNQASHIITLRMNDSDAEIRLSTAGDINSLMLGYALTVHKSQGSEWRKVFFITHQSHATMLQRELLYTAVTRAREELYIVCEPETLMKGIQSQRVKGDTLAEKAEHFKGKIDAGFKL